MTLVLLRNPALLNQFKHLLMFMHFPKYATMRLLVLSLSCATMRLFVFIESLLFDFQILPSDQVFGLIIVSTN